jgi:hypothetical protein
MDINNRYSSVYTDTYGIDPLMDRTVPALMGLPLSRTHIVLSSERGRPDLISYREYGVVTLWWVVMLCNKIYNHKELIEGKVLLLPEFSSISTSTTLAFQKQTPKNSTSKTVSVSF